MKSIAISFFSLLFFLDPRDSFPRIGNAARLLIKWPWYRDKRLGAERLRSCRECQLFDPKRQTCGYIPETMEHPVTRRQVPVGCWCYLPVAAELPSKDCWGRANDLDVGWPDRLRPKTP